jgi:hypothetical protein
MIHLIRRPGRLEYTLLIAMSGFLVDHSLTQWIINNFVGFSESNMHLNPQLGLPPMVFGYIFGELTLPKTKPFNLLMYTLSLMQWTGPLQNILVFFNIIHGLNFLYVVPLIAAGTFITMYLVVHDGTPRI